MKAFGMIFLILFCVITLFGAFVAGGTGDIPRAGALIILSLLGLIILHLITRRIIIDARKGADEYKRNIRRL